MSRHSKWSKIKHQKGTEDAKRGILFTKLAKVITLAAREGGSDPKMNFKLRLALDQARAANLPKENVERAIQKGAGASSEAAIERVQYEGFLPGGAVVLIDSLTDNKNRTSGVIKHLLSSYGGNLGAPNSVLWMFEKKGVVRISNYKTIVQSLEELQLKLIDLGADDIRIEDEDLVVYVKPKNLPNFKEGLEKANLVSGYTEIEWVPKEKKEIQDPALKGKIESLFDEMDENEEINNYYTNINNI